MQFRNKTKAMNAQFRNRYIACDTLNASTLTIHASIQNSLASAKLRHAAALALVGIYLIVPYHQGPHYGNWNVVGRYATVESCVVAVADLQAEGFASSAVWMCPRVSMEPWQKQS